MFGSNDVYAGGAGADTCHQEQDGGGIIDFSC